MSSTSKHLCHAQPAEMNESSGKEERRSEKDFYKDKNGAENTYFVD